MNFDKILIIQTAFIGDVILATSLIEKLHEFYPDSKIDFMVRKGNESLLKDHPKLNKVIVWDKKGGKYKNLFKLIPTVRKEKYNLLINLQRFATAGFFSILSGASYKVCFDKNPFSILFDHKVIHQIDPESKTHEVKRNQMLIEKLTDDKPCKPKLYPSVNDFEKVTSFKSEPFICMAPTSVWFTKQYPKEKWVDLINQLSFDGKIYLLGAPSDYDPCEEIIKQTDKKSHVINLAGKLSLLQSAALMDDAVINIVNDSAPMHIASSMNAPTCAVFCSTIPGFGFGPLSDFSKVVEVAPNLLECRPCGLHGHKKCPKSHYDCGFKIDTNQIIKSINEAVAIYN